MEIVILAGIPSFMQQNLIKLMVIIPNKERTERRKEKQQNYSLVNEFAPIEQEK